MPISHFSSGSARAAFRREYEAALRALWPVPYTERYVETGFGATHVIVSGNRQRTPLVLIHAAGTTGLLWHRQVAHLSAEHSVFAIDIMGDIGLSEQTRPLRTRADAASWLSELVAQLGLERPALVGASFGGFLAANLAVHRPDQVSALALLAPAATLLPFRLRANLLIRIGSLLPLPFTVAPALRSMMSGELPDARFVSVMESGVRTFRYDRQGIYPSAFSDGELSSIACPVLVVLGENEVIYDPAAAAQRARETMPHVDVLLLPGHSHLPGMQSPALVDERIVSFLARGDGVHVSRLPSPSSSVATLPCARNEATRR